MPGSAPVLILAGASGQNLEAAGKLGLEAIVGERIDSAYEPDAAALRVFPLGVPLLTIVTGVGLSRLWPIEFPGRYWVGGMIVAGAVFGLGLWSIVLFRRTGQSENPWKPTPQWSGGHSVSRAIPCICRWCWSASDSPCSS